MRIFIGWIRLFVAAMCRKAQNLQNAEQYRFKDAGIILSGMGGYLGLFYQEWAAISIFCYFEEMCTEETEKHFEMKIKCYN